jgi:hypothetical protein
MPAIRSIVRHHKERRSWNEDLLLSGVRADDLENDLCHVLSRDIWGFPSFRDLLHHEILSEYDASVLSRHIRARGLPLSDDFKFFETDWLADELRHHRGFRCLHMMLYGQVPYEIDRQLDARCGQFARIDRFLGDEFGLLVLLGYDEIVTTKAYARDFPIYDSFKHLGISQFIRHVARDEAFHFQRIVEILRTRFADRTAEVPALLNEIVTVDSPGEIYQDTFVLDHAEFPAELLASASALMMRLCDSRLCDSRRL